MTNFKIDDMQTLSYRVGIDTKTVADIMNPIGDKARALLKDNE